MIFLIRANGNFVLYFFFMVPFARVSFVSRIQLLHDSRPNSALQACSQDNMIV
jgi:hypothetical protein